MKQLDAAILTALNAASVASSGGGVWKRRVPEGTTFPYVVFFQAAGTPRYTFPVRNRTEFVYVVKAMDEGDDNESVCDLDAAIDAVLSDNDLEDVALADSAGVVISCRRESEIEFEEEDEPGRRVQHKGAAYRIIVVPAG